MAEKEIRDVHARTFVVGDLHAHIELSGAELAELAAQIVRALRVPGAEVGDGAIRTVEGELTVSRAQMDGLRQYVEAAPGETQAEREMQYLMRLCIDPMLRQWHQQYVTLSGGHKLGPKGRSILALQRIREKNGLLSASRLPGRTRIVLN